MGPIAWRARGVAAVIGPANFPLHLLHGLVVPALAVGCTVIAKPSERCIALGQAYAKAAHDCGLDQVLAVVPGGAELALALARLPQVATVAAVGGHAMGAALARACAERPETVLALELGGVNHAVVLPDAAFEATVDAVAEGAWKMAGQRCTATRVVHVPRGARERVPAGRWRARAVAGCPPPIPRARSDAGSAPRRASTSVKRGARCPRACAWSPARRPVSGAALEARATASAAADPLLIAVEAPRARERATARSSSARGLVVDAYDHLDEAVARMAANPYRLAASVFTASRAAFDALAAAAWPTARSTGTDRPPARARTCPSAAAARAAMADPRRLPRARSSPTRPRCGHDARAGGQRRRLEVEVHL